MKKSEALNYIRLQKGYVPYIITFDIYNDEEEIPQEFIDLFLGEDKPKDIAIFVGEALAEELKKLI
jgi:hypothetical protein